MVLFKRAIRNQIVRYIHIRRLTTEQAATTSRRKTKVDNRQEMFRAGLPFVLFSILGAWVVSSALQGKLREMEAAQGKASKSLRQAAMESEHDEMMERLNKIVSTDFDNTKRIKRPQEILEERRLERERKNAWYRRLYRWTFRINSD